MREHPCPCSSRSTFASAQPSPSFDFPSSFVHPSQLQCRLRGVLALGAEFQVVRLPTPKLSSRLPQVNIIFPSSVDLTSPSRPSACNHGRVNSLFRITISIRHASIIGPQSFASRQTHARAPATAACSHSPASAPLTSSSSIFALRRPSHHDDSTTAFFPHPQPNRRGSHDQLLIVALTVPPRVSHGHADRPSSIELGHHRGDQAVGGGRCGRTDAWCTAAPSE